MSRVRYDRERATDLAAKKLLYARWRAAGCCGSCGIPIRKYAKCQRCRARHARSNLRYYHATKTQAASA